MTKFQFSTRIEKVLQNMAQSGVDALIITPSSDLKYLVGYNHPRDDKLLAAVLAPGCRSFIVASPLHDFVPEQLPVDDACYYNYKLDPITLLLEEMKKRGMGLKKLAVEPDMPCRYLEEILRQVPGVEIAYATELVNPLRAIKDQQELDAMQLACQKAETALKTCMDQKRYWIGKTENELEAQMVYEMSRLGMKNNAISVCFGANAAIPHHHPDSTVITDGQPLLIDFGGTYDNYNSDMTRMFHFGQPDAEYQKVYEIVHGALMAGLDACRLGNTLQEVDRVTRAYITERGYGKEYIHRTSHGIGLDCHDEPKIPVDGETVIVPGMAFSVEPGIYLPGRFGIRIEDQVAMTEQGATVLHTFPREMTIYD